MKNKSFINGVIWFFCILIIIFRLIAIYDIAVVIKAFAGGGERYGIFVAICGIILNLVIGAMIVTICIELNVFINNSFSENPFIESTVRALSKIYKSLICLTLINPIIITCGENNLHGIVLIGLGTKSIKVNNVMLTWGIEVNADLLMILAFASLVWILSVCFEKAFEIKNNNTKLKEENDLTI